MPNNNINGDVIEPAVPLSRRSLGQPKRRTGCSSQVSAEACALPSAADQNEESSSDVEIVGCKFAPKKKCKAELLLRV